MFCYIIDIVLDEDGVRFQNNFISKSVRGVLIGKFVRLYKFGISFVVKLSYYFKF